MTSVVSLEFLIWLVVTTGLYWASPLALRQLLLLLSTVCVLAALDPASLLALASMTAVVTVVTRVQGRAQSIALFAGCTMILAALAAFMNVDANRASASVSDSVVPLGLSYYSLRCMHVLLERHLKRIERPPISQLVNYLFFPATILAGPIHRFDDYIAKRSSDFRADQFSTGLERILYGYVKIVVLSNYLLNTKFFPWALSLVNPLGAQHQYLEALDYGLSLYLQFSGYSDIAIGFALLLGYKIIENFSWPFMKTNIAAFWRSWHISLTGLCREYLLPGVQAATGRPWVAVFATMVAIALWHGMTMNYMAWGIYHATGLLVYRAWAASAAAATMRECLPVSLYSVLGWFATFQFVILGFFFTKERSLSDSFNAFATLLSGAPGGV